MKRKSQELRQRFSHLKREWSETREKNLNRLGHYFSHISSRLITQLRLFTIIFMVMFGIVVFEVTQHTLTISLAAAGILLGVVIGVLMSRMIHLSWNEEVREVIGRTDEIGVIILVLYIATNILLRTVFLGYFAQGAALTALIICIVAGSMLGRMIKTRHGIYKVLEAWKIVGNEEPGLN